MLLSGPGTCQGSARARLGRISPSPGDLALNQALGGASLSKGSSAHLFSIPAAFPGTLRAGKALERFSNLTDPRILWLLCSARRVCEDRGGRQGSSIFIGIFFYFSQTRPPYPLSSSGSGALPQQIPQSISPKALELLKASNPNSHAVLMDCKVNLLRPSLV